MGLGGLGMWEMIMIFLVVLLLFGAKRLPEIGSSLGKGIREFKGSIREIEKEVKAVGEDEPQHDAVPPTSAPEQGPRRLTTTPEPASGVRQPGGVPTQEGPEQDGPGAEAGAAGLEEAGSEGPTSEENGSEEDGSEGPGSEEEKAPTE